MEGMEYFYELFERLPRCGPGTNECTRRAYNALPNVPEDPHILDIGCGPGVQTLALARASHGKIVALDNHQPFLDTLSDSARKEGLADHIIFNNESMLDMAFDENTFDIVWSEGALYFMGFGNGLRRCRQLLKERGYLAVSEVVYLLPNPPVPLVQYWEKEYPDIDDVKTKVELIQREGFRLLTHFTLPKSAWLDSFYSPMEEALDHLREKYRGDRIAQGVFETIWKEIDLYKKYSDYFGYEFFVMQKIG
jgi:ubiquinone/menaquinone biosynthesis C-methylase UbiE